MVTVKIMLLAMLMMMVMHGDDVGNGTNGDNCGINNSMNMILYAMVMMVLHGDENR